MQVHEANQCSHEATSAVDTSFHLVFIKTMHLLDSSAVTVVAFLESHSRCITAMFAHFWNFSGKRPRRCCYPVYLRGDDRVAGHGDGEADALADGSRVDLEQLVGSGLCLGLASMQAVLKLIQ